MKTKLLILLIIIFCSCGRKSTNETSNVGSVILIDLLSEPESENPSVSDIATNLDYIPLETTKNSLVKSMTKIITCDNKIYIKSNNNEILSFDNEGNFLYKLDKIGRGPGEYAFIADFDVSSDNKTLLVLSNGKILVFGNTGTEFLFTKSINLKRPFPSKIDMIPETTNILLSIDPMTGSEPSLSLLINTNGDTLHIKQNYYKFEKVDKFTRGMANESLHYDFGNSICFKEEFSDTVFFINKESNKFQPRLIFDSYGKGFPPRVRYDTEYAKNHATEIYWVYSVIESPRYVIYTYEHNMTRNKIIYDKSVNKKFKLKEWKIINNNASENGLKDDMNGGPVFDPTFCCESKVYSSVDALTLKKYVESDEFEKSKVSDPKKKEALRKLADSLKETDNPVLIVVTPRK